MGIRNKQYIKRYMKLYKSNIYKDIWELEYIKIGHCVTGDSTTYFVAIEPRNESLGRISITKSKLDRVIYEEGGEGRDRDFREVSCFHLRARSLG
jgi:hypothetical protein